MSAGGLSYSGLTNFGKVTLPSVETWGTNNNIIKDPCQSIQTRRINKVGETSDITTMIDESSNRACEAINVYARGVNPSVSVDFGNYGSNSGGLSGSLQNNNKTQAFSPYTIMKGGAFRPPLLTQQMLMPLSRQPRVWTNVMTKPEFIDYTKRVVEMQKDCTKMKEIKDEVIKGCVNPTTYVKNNDSVNNASKYVASSIKDVDTINLDGIISRTDSVMQSIPETLGGTHEEILIAHADTNKGDSSKFVDNNKKFTESYVNKELLNGTLSTNNSTINDTNRSTVDTERFMQNPLHTEKNGMLILTGETNSDIVMDTDRFLQNPNNIDVSVNQSGTGEFNANNIAESKRYLQDNLNAFAYSNKSQNISAGENIKETSSYLQARNLTEATTNINSNCNNTTCITDIADLNVISVKDLPKISKDGTIISAAEQKYIHSDIDLARNLPNYDIVVNKSQSGQQHMINPDKLKHLNRKTVERVDNINMNGISGTKILNTNASIPDKINIGNFESKPTIINLSGRGAYNENNAMSNIIKDPIAKKAVNFNDRFQGAFKKF